MKLRWQRLFAKQNFYLRENTEDISSRYVNLSVSCTYTHEESDHHLFQNRTCTALKLKRVKVQTRIESILRHFVLNCVVNLLFEQCSLISEKCTSRHQALKFCETGCNRTNITIFASNIVKRSH